MSQDFRVHFPQLRRTPNYAYLDSAATTLVPESVLLAVTAYDSEYRANIHRGLYKDACRATEAYESARARIAAYIGADTSEIIFTSGTTAALNGLVTSLTTQLTSNDTVVLSRAEHHANLVPWQEAAKIRGFAIRFLDINDAYEINESSFAQIDSSTKIVSVLHASNVCGSIFPVERIIAKAAQVGAISIIDAAQTIAHIPMNVRDLGCDFLVASGHKMYGPTGVGILYGKKQRLETLHPWTFGGSMVKEVTYEGASWNEIPERFEAGTPPISGVIGLGAAVDWINEAGHQNIQARETQVTMYALEALHRVHGVRLLGKPSVQGRLGVISFDVLNIHPHDVAEVLGGKGVAIRAGTHCAMPYVRAHKLAATARISFGAYSTTEDVDRFLDGLQTAQKLFA